MCASDGNTEPAPTIASVQSSATKRDDETTEPNAAIDSLENSASSNEKYEEQEGPTAADASDQSMNDDGRWFPSILIVYRLESRTGRQ